MRTFNIPERLRRLFGSREENESELTHDNPIHNVNSKIRIHLHKAINGRVIEVHSYNPKPQSHESDWDSEFYIVAEGESLHLAVSTVLTMKSLAA